MADLSDTTEYVVTVEMRYIDYDDAHRAHIEMSKVVSGVTEVARIRPACRVEIDISKPGDYAPLADEIARRVAERLAPEKPAEEAPSAP